MKEVKILRCSLAPPFMEALCIVSFSQVVCKVSDCVFRKFTHKMYTESLMAWEKKSHLVMRKIKCVTKFNENYNLWYLRNVFV